MGGMKQLCTLREALNREENLDGAVQWSRIFLQEFYRSSREEKKTSKEVYLAPLSLPNYFKSASLSSAGPSDA